MGSAAVAVSTLPTDAAHEGRSSAKSKEPVDRPTPPVVAKKNGYLELKQNKNGSNKEKHELKPLYFDFEFAYDIHK